MRAITVFKGDSTGPGVVDAVLQILRVAKIPSAYERFKVGEVEYERNGRLVPNAASASFEKGHVLLKAPITTPIGRGFRPLNMALRSKYDLYVNIRPAKSNTAVKTPSDHAGTATFHENMESLYVGMEKQIDADTVHAAEIIIRKASTRIIRGAFVYTRTNDRRKVTCAHKANILKMSGGTFPFILQEVTKDYSDIETDNKIVGDVCMQLVMRPEAFDVMVISDLYKDIVSDLTSSLIGGPGLLSSGNVGTDHAMFEAVHGPAPDTAGKYITNPTALLQSAYMILEYLQGNEYAANIRKAVDAVLMKQKYLTPDLYRSLATKEYRDAVIAKLSQLIRYMKQLYYRKTTAVLLQNFI